MDILLLIIFLLMLILIYALVKEYTINYSILTKIIISFIILLFVIAVVIYPDESFKAASQGVHIWFNSVLPSILPFFIGSELLVKLGVVDFIGVLLEPVMRPIFNVPGCGSFPFVMSITSGYPVGPKIISELYLNKMCNKSEAQRLLSFCSTSGPLFMIGAVAIGMLNSKAGGSIIAVSNYLGAITVGIIFRFYKYKDRSSAAYHFNNFNKATSALVESFNKEKRPFGQLLSEAVKNAVNTQLLIGGMIILFSVIIRLITLSGFIDIVSNLLYMALKNFGIDKSLLSASICGLFEITIGSKLISATQVALYQKIILISGIIAWSGFSIHAQVAGVLSNTDLKLGTYIFTKLLHSAASCIYAYLIIKIWGIKNVFAYTFTTDTNLNWASKLALSSERYVYIIALLILFALIVKVSNKLYHVLKG